MARAGKHGAGDSAAMRWYVSDALAIAVALGLVFGFAGAAGAAWWVDPASVWVNLADWSKLADAGFIHVALAAGAPSAAYLVAVRPHRPHPLAGGGA